MINPEVTDPFCRVFSHPQVAGCYTYPDHAIARGSIFICGCPRALSPTSIGRPLVGSSLEVDGLYLKPPMYTGDRPAHQSLNLLHRLQESLGARLRINPIQVDCYHTREFPPGVRHAFLHADGTTGFQAVPAIRLVLPPFDKRLSSPFSTAS
jgi:hypothetical protein